MVTLPKALKLRRKYEVDENHWLVIWARPKYEKFIIRVTPKYEKLRVAVRSGELTSFRFPSFRFPSLRFPSITGWAHPKYEKLHLIARFRGFPKSYESSFVLKMDRFEREGIAFIEVLRDTTPKLFGEGPAEVLRRWIGSKARRNPVKFAKTISKMFGSSAKPVLDSLQALADDKAMLAAKVEEIPPVQYLLERMVSLGIKV
jgi:hypothetical protein